VLALDLARAATGRCCSKPGGMDEDRWTRQLFEAPNVGSPYRPLGNAQGHRFGGTTYKYGGHFAPVTQRDFDPVPGAPLAAWPVTFAEVEPWTVRAEHLLGLQPEDFDAERRTREVGIAPPDPRLGTVAGTALFARNRSDYEPFPQRFAADLVQARDLEVVLRAVVIGIELDARGDHVHSLTVRTQSGSCATVVADASVLASHSVENARLLLDGSRVADGLGNRSGWVGRCFADHPHLDSGTVHFPGVVPWHLVYPAMERRGFVTMLTVPQAVTDAAGCFQYFCRLLPLGAPADLAIDAVARGWRRPWTPRSRRAIRSLARSRRTTAHAAVWAAGVASRTFLLSRRIEQAPNPSSRIVLSGERDALGRRRAAVDWHLEDTDFRTLEVGQATALRYLERIGATRIRPSRRDPAFVAGHGSTYWHYIGTTRMASSPSEGVVDADSRVHGVDNLFVAGSSVFCRATFVPPTLTIVALALRLAHHLDGRLRPARPVRLYPAAGVSTL
jgi:choline dehydrogenase-like flavoprotein